MPKNSSTYFSVWTIYIYSSSPISVFFQYDLLTNIFFYVVLENMQPTCCRRHVDARVTSVSSLTQYSTDAGLLLCNITHNIRAVPNIRLVFAQALNSESNNLLVFGHQCAQIE